MSWHLVNTLGLLLDGIGVVILAWGLLVDLDEERLELFRAMALKALPDDVSSGDVESGEESRGPMTLVVVGSALGLARS